MQEIDLEKAIAKLNEIMELELAGVVRFTHYSLMVTGPHRLPIVQFMKDNAAESLTHAQTVGEIITGLGGHPTMRIAAIEESGKHAVRDILEEGHSHERRAIQAYRELLDIVADRSIYLEEFARGQVSAEELHVMELTKMLRDLDG